MVGNLGEDKVGAAAARLIGGAARQHIRRPPPGSRPAAVLLRHRTRARGQGNGAAIAAAKDLPQRRVAGQPDPPGKLPIMPECFLLPAKRRDAGKAQHRRQHPAGHLVQRRHRRFDADVAAYPQEPVPFHHRPDIVGHSPASRSFAVAAITSPKSPPRDEPMMAARAIFK